jgi:hypothetical protein
VTGCSFKGIQPGIILGWFIFIFVLSGLHLGAIVDTIIVAIVWVLSLTDGWLCDTILRLGVVNLTIAILASVVWILVAEAVVVVLVVGVTVIGKVVDSRAVSSMALTVGAELVGVSMLGQSVVVSSSSVLAAAEDAAEEATLGAVSRGVVVGGTRTKALLLAMVAGKCNFDKDRQDEEDTGSMLDLR